MGESVSVQRQIADFVSGKIRRLSVMSSEGQVKAELANLRRGVGKKPGENPELWGVLFQDFPEELYQGSKEGVPSKVEWAVYLSLTLYAMHQQGHDIAKDNMHKDGESLGTAVRRLVPDTESEEKSSMFRKFQVMATSADIEELSHHLRGIIQLLSREGIGIDYAKLSENLYWYQFENGRDSVRLQWGRDYFNFFKE